jgi:hypothetical protein
MSLDTERRVRLGTVDWLHPEWLGGFYPEDMPADWQLTNFNTQFSCVWLPRARWQKADLPTLRQWREDTHEDFRFLLEAADEAEGSHVEVTEALGDRLAKICSPDDPDLLWFDDATDLKKLAEEINARGDEPHAFLLSRDGNLTTLDQVGTLLGLLGL